MPLPRITSLQTAVLALLSGREGETAGIELRDLLASKHGTKVSGPSFYQAMARLEQAGFVEGRYEQKLIDGLPVKERRYRLTAEGAAALEDARLFSATCFGLPGLAGT